MVAKLKHKMKYANVPGKNHVQPILRKPRAATPYCYFAIIDDTLLPGISVTAPIRRSTPWAFIRKNFPFVPTIEMSTLFSFPSKNQLNAQGAVTENPGSMR